MTDDSSSKGTKAAPYLFDFFSLALILGAEEAFRATASWHWWGGELAAGVLCGVIGLRWSQVTSLTIKINPWAQLRQARREVADRRKQLIEAIAAKENCEGRLNQLRGQHDRNTADLQKRVNDTGPQHHVSEPWLIIHSAEYGPENGIALDNVTLAVQALIVRHAVDVVVSDELFPASRNRAILPPALGGIRNVLKVKYSYKDKEQQEIVKFSGSRLELPEPDLPPVRTHRRLDVSQADGLVTMAVARQT